MIALKPGDRLSSINIGKQGENLAERVVIDTNGWASGEMSLIHSIGGNTYPCTIEVESGLVIWDIRGCDTAVAGNGELELTCTDRDRIVKNRIWVTLVEPSLVPDSDPPDPVENWVEHANTKLSLVMDSLETAHEALRVSNSVLDRANAGEFNGAKGDKGDKGDRGETGAQGRPGYTPVKGIDYFDGAPGEKGDKGEPGYTPVKGIDYFDGRAGQQGEKGDKGDRGEKGERGERGYPGIPGDPGAKGDKGEKGEPGNDGHTPTADELTQIITPLVPDSVRAKSIAADVSSFDSITAQGTYYVTTANSQSMANAPEKNYGVLSVTYGSDVPGNVCQTYASGSGCYYIRIKTSGGWGTWTKVNGEPVDTVDQRVFIITEDMVTVATDATKGVAPYSTSYGYTNITINKDAGVEWVEGGIYSFCVDTKMVVASATRNIRVRIGDSGAWHPVMDYSTSILGGSSYFIKAMTVLFQYKTTMRTEGGLHRLYDANTTYAYLVNTVAGDATSSPIKIAANGYGARYSLIFPTERDESEWSSLVKSSSTGTTKAAAPCTFYATHDPMYIYSANVAAGKKPVNSLYQYYQTADLRYTANVNNTYLLPYERVFLVLTDFEPSDCSFSSTATIGAVLSESKIDAWWSKNHGELMYLYFLGYTTATWYQLNPIQVEAPRIWIYEGSDLEVFRREDWLIQQLREELELY